MNISVQLVSVILVKRLTKLRQDESFWRCCCRQTFWFHCNNNLIYDFFRICVSLYLILYSHLAFHSSLNHFHLDKKVRYNNKLQREWILLTDLISPKLNFSWEQRDQQRICCSHSNYSRVTNAKTDDSCENRCDLRLHAAPQNRASRLQSMWK